MEFEYLVLFSFGVSDALIALWMKFKNINKRFQNGCNDGDERTAMD